MPAPSALLLSGYHSISQQGWADYVLSTCDQYQWSSICLPPRYFSWRMRGGPLSLAAMSSELLDSNYDLLVATSSIDLSVVQSIYPMLRNIPSILYFHENQFSYPTNNQPASVIDWQMVNLYSAIRADKLIFNSQYNLQSFYSGVEKLLKKLPDLVPKNIVTQLRNKSSVLPVPIQSPTLIPKNNENKGPIKILWNHRWEWDKCPELLLSIIEKLVEQKYSFQLFLTGQQFRTIPTALRELNDRFSSHIEHSGFLDSKDDYQRLIKNCDIILSTAIHEFQGIAVMEAVSSGCIPLLPHRLSYPDFFSQDYLFKADGSIEDQANSAVKKISHWINKGLPELPDLSMFYEDELKAKYQTMISA